MLLKKIKYARARDHHRSGVPGISTRPAWMPRRRSGPGKAAAICTGRSWLSHCRGELAFARTWQVRRSETRAGWTLCEPGGPAKRRGATRADRPSFRGLVVTGVPRARRVGSPGWPRPEQGRVSCVAPIDPVWRPELRRGPRAVAAGLHVVVEAEFERVRAQPEGIDLVGRLVPDPGVDHVGRKHVAPQQEIVVCP